MAHTIVGSKINRIKGAGVLGIFRDLVIMSLDILAQMILTMLFIV